MKRIKTFGQFITESFSIKENSAPRISSDGKRPTRAEGSPNWFTREEIDYIMDWGNRKDVNITESNKNQDCDGKNYFGDSQGVGLNDSAKNFYRGGDLCAIVNIDTEEFSGSILKKNFKFETGGRTYDSIQEILN
jgi:hypothetical protein